MICLRGPHWVCPNCSTNNTKCNVHGSRCIQTHNLWYTTISSMTSSRIVCPRGCVATCKCNTPGRFVITMGSLGTFTSYATAHVMLTRAGGVSTACGLCVKPSKIPFTLELLSEMRHLKQTCKLQVSICCNVGGSNAITMVTRSSIQFGKLTYSLFATNALAVNTRAFLATFWPNVCIQHCQLILQNDTTQYTVCATRRRNRQHVHTLNKASSTVWLTLPLSEANTCPPGYVQLDNTYHCVWCQRIHSTLHDYTTLCAPDATHV